MKTFSSIIFAVAFLISSCGHASKTTQLLNVSYDSTREFYDAYDKLFVAYWMQKTGQAVEIQQSHGGSGAQARAVINGLAADVVTLALASDIDLIAQQSKLLPIDWQKQLPNNSCPYTSTVVFLVRRGNPKQIKDWPDLIRTGVQVITPNPKTSGGGRWNYMAAWGYALKKNGDNEAAAKDFITKLYKNVPILDAGARAATNSFVQRGMGDVLLAWENEAYLVMSKTAHQQFAVVMPSMSILAEPPVALIIKNSQKKGTVALANAYLTTLYTPQAQDLIARFFYRPLNTSVLTKNKRLFPEVTLFTIQDMGGWLQVQKKQFQDGGIFDQIFYGKP